jgi:hypothetical protein
MSLPQPDNTGRGEAANRALESPVDLWTVIIREQWDFTRFSETMSRSPDDLAWKRTRKQLTQCKSKHHLDSDAEAFVWYTNGLVKPRSRRKDAGQTRASKVATPGATDLAAVSPANEEPPSPVPPWLQTSSPVISSHAEPYSPLAATPHPDDDNYTSAVLPSHQVREITGPEEQSLPCPLHLQVIMLTEELRQSKAREARKDIEVEGVRNSLFRLQYAVRDGEMKIAELEETIIHRNKLLTDFYQQKLRLQEKLDTVHRKVSEIAASCGDVNVVRQLVEAMRLAIDDHSAMVVNQANGQASRMSGDGEDDDDDDDHDDDVESSEVDEDEDDDDGSESSGTVDDDHHMEESDEEVLSDGRANSSGDYRPRICKLNRADY